MHSTAHLLDTWLYTATCFWSDNLSLLDLCSNISCQDAAKYTLSRQPSIPLSKFPSTLPGMLSRSPLCLFNSTNGVSLTVFSQEYSQETLKYTTEYTLKYLSEYTHKDTSNCTIRHTHSLFGTTFSSTLSRGKTLPISLEYMLHSMLLGDWSTDILNS